MYFNELPAMVMNMLAAAGVAAECKEVTPGGQRFAGHAVDSRVATLLSESWDVVILQDNSGVPGGYNFDALMASRAALMTALVPQVPDTARLVLYGTWGHLRGSVYEDQQSAYPDYVTMQRRTTDGIEGYVELIKGSAPSRSVEFAPVGDAFLILYNEEVQAGRDPLEPDSLFARLYAPDAFHPSRIGSFLAACVFTRVLLEGDDARISQSLAFRPADSCKLDRRLQDKYGDEWAPRIMDEADVARVQRAAAKALEARVRL